VKVVLPDESELELPDGATGLDAARAIGPKLAEQAVLVRANDSTQDLRLPLPDGARRRYWASNGALRGRRQARLRAAAGRGGVLGQAPNPAAT